MDIKILFGSETGNSEEIAKKISKDLLSIEYKTNPLTLNAFTTEIDKLRMNQNKKIIIIVCSTTGNGDPPKSSDKFIRLIRNKNLDSNYLNGFEFALLGLGDSNYSKFQAIPKLIDSNLLRLGAKSFVLRGQADDAYGLEETVEPWVEALITKIKKEKENIVLSVTNKPDDIDINFTLSLNEAFKSSDYSDFSKQANYQVEQNVKISGPLAVKDVYHLKINKIQDVNSSNENEIVYEPGSHICLLPELEQVKVNKLLEIIKITSSDLRLVVSQTEFIQLPIDITEQNVHLQTQYTKNKGYFSKEDLFKYVLDFSTPMKKGNLIKFFEIIEETLSNESKIKSSILSLRKIITNDFNNFTKNKMNFYELLMKIKSKDILFILNVHINHLLNLINIKQPRRYSLSTSYMHDIHMGIYYSVVDERIFRKGLNEILTSETARYLGEATNFMKGMSSKSKFYVTGIENFFPFNKEIHVKHSKPLIYVSNGTGISPVVSYLKNISRESKEEIGSLYIITGFRSNTKESNDSIEEEFINKFVSEVNASCNSMFNAPLSNSKAAYFSCYSNDDKNDDEECGYWRNVRINYDYVQDIVNDKKDLLYNLLIEDEGIMMICGDVEKIYAEVLNTFLYQLKSKRLIEREEAVYILEKLKSQGRILLEKWH